MDLKFPVVRARIMVGKVKINHAGIIRSSGVCIISHSRHRAMASVKVIIAITTAPSETSNPWAMGSAATAAVVNREKAFVYFLFSLQALFWFAAARGYMRVHYVPIVESISRSFVQRLRRRRRRRRWTQLRNLIGSLSLVSVAPAAFGSFSSRF